MQYFKYTYLFQNCDKMDWISKISSWNSNMENARIKGECIEIRFVKMTRDLAESYKMEQEDDEE